MYRTITNTLLPWAAGRLLLRDKQSNMASIGLGDNGFNVPGDLREEEFLRSRMALTDSNQTLILFSNGLTKCYCNTVGYIKGRRSGTAHNLHTECVKLPMIANGHFDDEVSRDKARSYESLARDLERKLETLRQNGNIVWIPNGETNVYEFSESEGSGGTVFTLENVYRFNSAEMMQEWYGRNVNRK